jgi:hypothetical protein
MVHGTCLKGQEVGIKLWFVTILNIFFLIVFFTQEGTPRILRFYFVLHSRNSCRPSGDCGGSRDQTRNGCVAAWYHLVDLTTELPHPQPLSYHIPTTELPHPHHWATTSPPLSYHIPIELPHPFLKLIAKVKPCSTWSLTLTRSTGQASTSWPKLFGLEIQLVILSFKVFRFRTIFWAKGRWSNTLQECLKLFWQNGWQCCSKRVSY